MKISKKLVAQILYEITTFLSWLPHIIVITFLLVIFYTNFKIAFYIILAALSIISIVICLVVLHEWAKENK